VCVSKIVSVLVDVVQLAYFRFHTKLTGFCWIIAIYFGVHFFRTQCTYGNLLNCDDLHKLIVTMHCVYEVHAHQMKEDFSLRLLSWRLHILMDSNNSSRYSHYIIATSYDAIVLCVDVSYISCCLFTVMGTSYTFLLFVIVITLVNCTDLYICITAVRVQLTSNITCRLLTVVHVDCIVGFIQNRQQWSNTASTSRIYCSFSAVCWYHVLILARLGFFFASLSVRSVLEKTSCAEISYITLGQH